MAEERYTYNRHTWEDNELITQANLNNIEAGLAQIAEPALNSIRFDSFQRLGEDEKERARTNLGIAAGTVLTTENLDAGTDLVSYGKEQTLEDSEKERARSNIDALGINDVSSHDDPLINLKEEINVSDYSNDGFVQGKCLYITDANFNKTSPKDYTGTYNISGYIPVKSGCKLTFTNVLESNSYGGIFYKADKKTYIKPGYSGNTLRTANYIIVPENASWLRITYMVDTPTLITQTTAAHDELVEKISDVVVIDDSESNTNDNTKLWIHATPEQEIQIPTMEDFNKLSGRIPTFDLTNESLNRLEEIDLNGLANYSDEITNIKTRVTKLETQADNYRINVKDYKHDDDPDDTAAFIRAFQTISDEGYSELYVPTAHKEQYVITQTLTFPRNLRKIYGDGTAHGSSEFGSILFDANNFSTELNAKRAAPLFQYPATSDASPQMLHITNLCFKAASQPGTGAESAHRIGLFLDATNSLVDKDIEFSNCMITNFYTIFNFKGRGLSVINSYITSSNYIATINWDDNSDTNSNHPANMNQRAIYFKNNRLHSITSGFLNIASGHAYGLTFQNNTIDDGRGYLIKATEEAWNWIIQGNLFNGIWSNPENNFIYFSKGCKNCSITNNLFSADPRYWKEEYADQQKFGTTILANWQWVRINLTATNTNISNNIFEFGYSAAIQANALYGCAISNNNFVNTTFSTAVTPIYIIEALQGSSIIGNTFLYEYITFSGTFKSAPTAAERTLVYNDIIKNGYKNIAAKGCISLNTGTPINSTILGNNLTTTIPAEDLEENN